MWPPHPEKKNVPSFKTSKSTRAQTGSPGKNGATGTSKKDCRTKTNGKAGGTENKIPLTRAVIGNGVRKKMVENGLNSHLFK